MAIKIIYNVSIIINENFVKIGEHRFDEYDASKCKQDIRKNRPDLMKRIINHSWDVSVKEWT